MGAKLKPVFFTVLFFSVFPLFTQDEGSAPKALFYIEQTETEIRFVQRFAWGRDIYDYRYEVIIEQEEEDGIWVEILRETCEENFIEVSLPPGSYRYQVLVYNLLDKQEYAMEHLPFTIIYAVEPRINSINPSGFFLDDNAQWTVNLEGRGFEEGAEFSLQQGDRRITPREVLVDPSGTSALLVFAFKDLVTGNYEAVAKNPNGLTGVMDAFGIAWRKPLDINLSAGWAPLVPLYGELNKILQTPFMPLGFMARLSVVPIKRWWGFIGAELAPSWNYLNAPIEGEIGDYKVYAHIVSVQLHGLYQYWFIKRTLALNVRLGAGFSSIANMYIDYGNDTSERISSTMFSVDGGVSLQWVFYKSLFVEAGADFTHFFSKDNSSPGYLRPSITLGWQF